MTDADVAAVRDANQRAMTPGRPPRVLFAGSRGWTDARSIRDRVHTLPAESVVIHGGAGGADTLAGYAAANRGDLYVVQVDALWTHLRRRAGHARNDVALGLLDPTHDWCEIFWDRQSPGTHGLIVRAERIGVPFNVHYQGGGRRTCASLQPTERLW